MLGGFWRCGNVRAFGSWFLIGADFVMHCGRAQVWPRDVWYLNTNLF